MSRRRTQNSKADRPALRRAASAQLAAALWTAVLLALLRAGFLFTMDRAAHGLALSFASARLAEALPNLVLAALATAALTWAVARAVRPRALAFLLMGALNFAFLSGLPLGDPRYAPGWETSRGQLALGALALTSLVVAALVLRRSSRAGRAPHPLLAIGVPTALLGLTPLLAPSWLSGSNPSMTLLEVVAEPLELPSGLTAIDGEHRVGVLCTTPDWRLDGGDMPAVILPPPASVELLAPALRAAADEPLTLRVAAGIDRAQLTALPPNAPQAAESAGVRFQVEINDRLRFDETIWLRQDGPASEQPWIRAGGDAGLRVRPGDRVVLRTLLPAGVRAEQLGQPVLAGFGGLRFERELERERLAASAEHPNVVLVVMDTLRRDRLSTYGYRGRAGTSAHRAGAKTSPQLDRLAARGRVFDQAYATASYTWPATASILTGLEPAHHGVLGGSSCYLTTQLDALAEALQSQGYSTAAWSGNPLVSARKNFDQGFEVFDSDPAVFRKSDKFLDRALEWIELCGDRRFLLYLHLVEPHTPLRPDEDARALFAPDVPLDHSPNALYETLWRLKAARSPEQLDRALASVPQAERDWMSDTYDACVRTGDARLGRVLDKLEELGLTDDTLIVFTADHGEEIFDHGLTSHGQSLHAELVQVPLVIAGPGVAAERVDVPVSNRHLATTLAIAGGGSLRGIPDPLDLLAGTPESRPVLFSTHHGWWNGWSETPLYGARAGKHVLHWAPSAGPWGVTPPPEDGDWRLFDLSADPEEFDDRSAEAPGAAKRLRALLQGRLKDLGRRRTGRAFGAGQGTLDMLRDVGYAGSESEADALPSPEEVEPSGPR